MGSSCKERVAVHIMLAVQILLAVFTTATWTRTASPQPCKVLGDVATALCKNLMPDRTAAVMNGVYVPPGAVSSVPVSRSKLTITIQLVVTGKPLNQALNAVYTVKIAPKLLNAPRILFLLELKRPCKSCGTNCEGCETGVPCLKTPSLLGYLIGFQECHDQEAPIGIRSSDAPAVPPVLVSSVTPLAPKAPLSLLPPDIIKQLANSRGMMY